MFAQRGVAEQHGVKALRDGERDRRRGLRAGGAGAVVAPVGGGAGGIDEGELERAGAVEVHRADGDAALVVDELRHLRMEGRNGNGGSQEQGESPYTSYHVHEVFG